MALGEDTAAILQCASQGELLNSSNKSSVLTGICSWLGQNSKQGKLNRQLMDIQARMRLKMSADKQELRQHYIPSLFPHIIKPLVDEGAVSLL